MKCAVYNHQGERIQNLHGKATHHQVAGGLDTMEIETSDSFLKKGYRLLYRDRYGKFFEFIVSTIEELHDNEGISYNVYAENSLVELRTAKIIMDRRGLNSTAGEAVRIIAQDTDWSVSAEDLGRADFNFYHVTPMEALSDTLKIFGGEFETRITVEGLHISRSLLLKKQVGKDLGRRFSYRKDMKEIKRTVREEDIVTRLFAYGKGEKTENGYGRRISFSDINGGIPYVENLEAQEQYSYLNRPLCAVKVYDNIEDKGELLKRAKEDLARLSKPSISYEASVVSLEGYGMEFEGVGVGDVVKIRDRDLGLALEGRVSEMVIDPDGEKPTQITLGSIREAIGSEYEIIQKTLDRVTAKEGALDALADPKTFMDRVVAGLNDAFQTTSSYAKFDPETGLTFTDKPDQSKASWAINIGSRGFRIASGKLANGEWDWRTFGTGEGFTADLIRTGKIKGELITLDGKTTVTDDFSVAGGNVTLSGDTTVLGTFKVPTSAVIGTLSADRIQGGTINARNIKVTNMNADYITDGTLGRGVDNGSCTLPESGSAYLSGSGTSLDTGSAGFQFIYSGSYENTFLVDGRITAKPYSGQHMAFQVGSLYVGANGDYFKVSPGHSRVDIQSSGPYRFDNRVICTGLTIGSATLTESDINKLKRL